MPSWLIWKSMRLLILGSWVLGLQVGCRDHLKKKKFLKSQQPSAVHFFIKRYQKYTHHPIVRSLVIFGPWKQYTLLEKVKDHTPTSHESQISSWKKKDNKRRFYFCGHQLSAIWAKLHKVYMHIILQLNAYNSIYLAGMRDQNLMSFG